ncbi:aminotransferase class I/II-fold pyridoxal phosphate-dependent enzyme [Cellulomonas terrae]|uniref:8-amino-7-oxononanoate synthase n=1 Tax=Cellulomonas terrae TaxID=311234 RepID=A0A511JL59_9CELL|nr:pyridoxal phosphate-dependent aminotransferase family protein [Cellulomonas terrae]GEL98363.1 8-amino-7-oxononanoate synthase [Cellulomonas terrae]
MLTQARALARTTVTPPSPPVRPELTRLDQGNLTWADFDGRRVRNFLSSNYLGMSVEPSVVDAAVAATLSYGTGVSGSRVTCGSLGVHEALEQELAEAFETSALLFTTGYAANLGVLGALASYGDTVVVDAHCHASVFDGVQLSGGQVATFRHDDPDDLATQLRTRGPVAAVVVCGVYPVLGDVADLVGIGAVARRHGVPLMVDEAHAFGVLGSGGLGTAELLRADVAVRTVTFSKALGSLGGAVLGPSELVSRLRSSSPVFRNAASPPPAAAAAALAAWRLVRQDPGRPARVTTGAARVRAELGDLVVPSSSGVVAVQAPDDRSADRYWEDLVEDGVLGARYAGRAAPDGRPVLRFAITAQHDDDDLAALTRSLRRHHPRSAHGPARQSATLP